MGDVDLQPGQAVDRYVVQAVLGEGGLATVYLVKHATLGSLHALKVLGASRPTVRRRLLQEGRAQAALQHPNVVAVTDVIEVGDAPALLMDYVPGLALDLWLERHSPSVREAVSLFRKILDGVEAAHALGMVHRDLKPANVMMEQQGDRWVPRVADFGLVKVLRELGADDEITRSRVGMGTPAYTAPEQLRDARRVDRRADVFSLGCIFYELVCGQRAFPGRDPLEVAEAVFRGTYERPQNLRPGVPVAVVDTIDGCLQGDPEHRFAHCEAVRRSLRRSAPPPPRPRKATSPWRFVGCMAAGFLVGFAAMSALAAGGLAGLVAAGILPFWSAP